MPDQGPDPRRDLQNTVHALFAEDPGTGFSLVNGEGIVTFTNARSAYLFLRGTPEQAIGRSLSEIFESPWAEERMRILARIKETGTPVILRHIRHGTQIQSTIRLLTEPDEDDATFLVLTVEGEHEPADPEQFEIIESKLVHLGPLGLLTRREIEVLALVGHGLSTAEMARALHRSPRTIERHCDSIRGKLQGATRVQMADFARRAGLRIEDSERERI